MEEVADAHALPAFAFFQISASSAGTMP